VARDAQVEAVVARVLERVCELGRVPHHLLRHAAEVHAGAAERAGLEQRDTRAILRCALRGREPATAAAEHDEVELLHVEVSASRLRRGE